MRSIPHLWEGFALIGGGQAGDMMVIDQSSLIRATTNFDGEGTGERLDRRKRSWIPSVNISSSKPQT